MIHNRNIVVNFHTITDIEWFERTIIILKNKFKIIDIRDIESFYHSGKIVRNACHITFDDGDLSFYEKVYPILLKHRLPVTLFVSPQILVNGGNFWFQEIEDYDIKEMVKILMSLTNKQEDYFFNKDIYSIIKLFPIDFAYQAIEIYQKENGVSPKPNQNMSLNQIEEIRKSGLVEIGAHTLTHPILKNETTERSNKEIRQSILLLESLLHQKVICFAYPNGWPEIDYSVREINILRDIGIKLAFSTENHSFSQKNDCLSIPRTGLSHGNSLYINTKLSLLPYVGHQWAYLRSKLYM